MKIPHVGGIYNGQTNTASSGNNEKVDETVLVYMEGGGAFKEAGRPVW